MVRGCLSARLLSLTLLVALLVAALAPAAAAQPRTEAGGVPPGGAPPAGSGPVDIAGPVRVIDGDTLEVRIGGRRVGVGLIGVSAPQGNTPCGRDAAGQLRALVRGGLRLEEDPALTFDDRLRRMYHAFTRDGRPVGEELARAGVARANGLGANRGQLAAAEAQARGAGRGCLWSGGRAGGGNSLSFATMSVTGGASTDTQAPASPSAVAAAAAATALPGGFVQEIVAAGANVPTAFTFLPDGRILIAEKAGTVRLYKNGALLPTPFLDLQDRVNDYWDRGLRGIAADPNFAQNGYVYVLYTYENDAGDYSGTKTQRLTRVTASGDTAPSDSEVVILGTTVGRSCNDFPSGTDCLPADAPSHEGGNIKFAADGNLFVTLGDAAHFNAVNDNALRVQNLDSLAGKTLRVTATGAGLSTNPFWNGNAEASRSKVWAYGLRNPWRFTLRPGSDLPYIGDVGWSTWDEIDVGVAGANLGWPCYEGDDRQGGYEPLAVCQALYTRGTDAVRFPLVAYNGGGGASVTGGVFYDGTAYPAQYQGAYFYGDVVQGFIRSLRVDGNNTLVGGVSDFATAADGPVDIEMGPDQNLYYLAINTGELRRIRYAGSGVVSCLGGEYLAEYYANTTLSGTPAFRRCETSVNDDWGAGGPGGGLGSDNFSVRWTGRHNFVAGEYTFTARADDGIRLWVDGALLIDAWKDQPPTQYQAARRLTGGEHEVKVEYYERVAGAVAQVGWQAMSTNRAPAVTISAPASSLRYKVGDVIAYAGSATDPEDGPIPDADLAWSVILQHCPNGFCHAHPFSDSTGPTGSFTVPDHGTDTHFELILAATDRDGQTSRTSIDIQPQTVPLTLDTSPPGLQVVFGGTRYTTPVAFTTTVGATHSIGVPAPQTVDGTTYDFAGWSDGGAQSHNITAGEGPATYTARWTARSTTPATRAEPLPGATYFPETGHNLSGAFRDFWHASGGLPVFGYPWTEEFQERNADNGQTYTVQYFERQRYEYHPEYAGSPYIVLLGRLGAADAERRGLTGGAPFRPLPAGTPSDADCDFFPETGHRLCWGFRAYWQRHGLEFGDPGVAYRESLALFGYPISEEFRMTLEDGREYTVQYFERARFEWHPQNAAPYDILLGLLGNQELRDRGWIP